MPLDAARWQLEIGATDKTAQAFASIDRRIRGIEKSFSGLSAQMDRDSRASGAALNSLGGLIGRIAPAAIAAAAAWRLWNAGMAAGALADQAEALTITTSQLQTWRVVAAQSGVAAEQLDKAIATLAGQMHAAASGNDDAIAKFDKLGVKLLDAKGQLRSVGDVLPEVAAGFGRITNDTERLGLAQELIGSRGGRLLNVLAQFAGGTDAVEQKLRSVNAIIERDTIDAWNKLDAQLQVTRAHSDAVIASLGAPIATWALEQIQKLMASIADDMARVKREAATVNSRAAANDVRQLEDQLAAARQRQSQFRPGSTGYNLEAGSIKALEARIAAMREAQELARQDEMELRRAARASQISPPPTPGAGQPTGTKAGAAGAKLDGRLRELADERQALERAMAAFDVKGSESVEQVERRINAQVALDKRTFDVLKDVPPRSPLAQQLKDEVATIGQLTLRLDERKRLLAEGQATVQKHGDGTRLAAYETDRLNQMLAAGAIDAGTYSRALLDVTMRAGDQERAARGAAGGWQGYAAGIEQAMEDMRRGNTEFERGRQLIGLIDDAIDALAGTAQKSFDRIAADFAIAFLKMEARAALSSLWQTLGGFGGIAGFFGGLFTAGAAAGPGTVAGGTLFFADGGDYPAGRPRVTGERGWELDIPRRPGTVLNQAQLAAIGGPTVQVYQTIQVGSFATRAELDAMRQTIRQESTQGAIAGVVEGKRRNSLRGF